MLIFYLTKTVKHVSYHDIHTSIDEDENDYVSRHASQTFTGCIRLEDLYGCLYTADTNLCTRFNFVDISTFQD